MFAAIPGRLAPKRRLSWRVDARLLVLINAKCSVAPYDNTFFSFVNRLTGLFISLNQRHSWRGLPYIAPE